jgi:hypothetical protein
MRAGLAIAGVGVAAAFCCAAAPLVAGITGLTVAGAFGVNGGIVAIGAVAVLLTVFLRVRSHGDDDRARVDG